jgi:hypothetical protein
MQTLPIPFIVGSPRSGTTLLRLMLDAHPDLAIPYETRFFTGRHPTVPTDFLQRQLLFALVMRKTRGDWVSFGISRFEFWWALQQIQPFSMAQGYEAFFDLYTKKKNKPRWGEKTPAHARSLPKIRELFPRAKFVHLIRDGRDSVISIRQRWWSPPTFAAQVQIWAGNVKAARGDGLGQPDYLEIRYENLILETRTQLEQICQHIELPFDQAMLEHHLHANERLAELKPLWIQSKKQMYSVEKRLQAHLNTVRPPDKTLIGKWKTELTVLEQEQFLEIAGDLLVELGYDTSIHIPNE